MINFVESTITVGAAIGLSCLAIGLYYELIGKKRRARRVASLRNADLVQ